MFELLAGVITLAAAIVPIWYSLHQHRKKKQLAAPEGAAGRLKQIQTGAREFRCGIIQHMPLAGFVETHNGPTIAEGLYAALLEDLAAREKLKVTWVGVPWARLLESFDELECDAVLSVFEDGPRSKHGDFILPFYRIGVGGLVRDSDTRVWTTELLKDPKVKIAAGVGEAGWNFLKYDLGILAGNIVALDNPHLESIAPLLTSGAADVAIADMLTLKKIADAAPGLRVVLRDPPLFQFKNSIFVPKGDAEWQGWLRKKLTEVRRSPEFQAQESAMLDSVAGYVERL